ncbi:Myosin-like coiled-coil protein [Lotmaria passim]
MSFPGTPAAPASGPAPAAAPSAKETAVSTLDVFSSNELHMAEAALRTVLGQKVQALAEEQGEAFIQSLIQKEIAKTKKLESDLAAVKKKLGAQERVVDDVRTEVRKTNALEEKAKSMCHALQDTAKKREQLTEKIRAEMESYRQGVRERVGQNVQNILDECEKKRERVEAAEAEVAELEATVTAKGKAFEQSFAQFKDGLKDRTSHYQALIASYQEAAKEVQLLEVRLAFVRRERNSVEMTRSGLQQQLEVYEKQFEGFAKSAMKPEDVEALAQRQYEQAQLRLTELEKDKAALHQQRLQMDKEVTDLRARLAALKRETQQLEKTRAAAEKRCRQAQQNRADKKQVKEGKTG